MTKKDREGFIELVNESEIGIAAGFSRPGEGGRMKGSVKFYYDEKDDYMQMPFIISAIIDAYAAAMGVSHETVLDALAMLRKPEFKQSVKKDLN